MPFYFERLCTVRFECRNEMISFLSLGDGADEDEDELLRRKLACKHFITCMYMLMCELHVLKPLNNSAANYVTFLVPDLCAGLKVEGSDVLCHQMPRHDRHVQ